MQGLFLRTLVQVCGLYQVCRIMCVFACVHACLCVCVYVCVGVWERIVRDTKFLYTEHAVIPAPHMLTNISLYTE